MGLTLLNLSGGIDSALCLHWALQEGRDVLAHHIVLSTRHGRETHESKAVAQILDWMPREVEYVESAFSWGDLERVRDVHVWALFTGAILARRRDVTDVITASHRDSYARHHERHWRTRSTEVLQGIVQLTARRQPVWHRPLEDMTKSQVVKAIPRSLLKLCWWCREPLSSGARCHRCLTCRQVDRAMGTM